MCWVKRERGRFRDRVVNLFRCRLLAGGASKDIKERGDVAVFGEDAVVVEVDVAHAAVRAGAAGEDVEEIDHVLIFGEDAVAVEVDAVASDVCSRAGGGEREGD